MARNISGMNPTLELTDTLGRNYHGSYNSKKHNKNNKIKDENNKTNDDNDNDRNDNNNNESNSDNLNNLSALSDFNIDTNNSTSDGREIGSGKKTKIKSEKNKKNKFISNGGNIEKVGKSVNYFLDFDTNFEADDESTFPFRNVRNVLHGDIYPKNVLQQRISAMGEEHSLSDIMEKGENGFVIVGGDRSPKQDRGGTDDSGSGDGVRNNTNDRNDRNSDSRNKGDRNNGDSNSDNDQCVDQNNANNNVNNNNIKNINNNKTNNKNSKNNKNHTHNRDHNTRPPGKIRVAITSRNNREVLFRRTEKLKKLTIF